MLHLKSEWCIHCLAHKRTGGPRLRLAASRRIKLRNFDETESLDPTDLRAKHARPLFETKKRPSSNFDPVAGPSRVNILAFHGNSVANPPVSTPVSLYVSPILEKQVLLNGYPAECSNASDAIRKRRKTTVGRGLRAPSRKVYGKEKRPGNFDARWNR